MEETVGQQDKLTPRQLDMMVRGLGPLPTFPSVVARMVSLIVGIGRGDDEAAESEFALLVGSDQSGPVQLLHRAVEAVHLLARARAADDYLPPELVQIEGVEGLSPLEEDVVRGVDDAADGPDAAGIEPSCHPAGRLARVHVPDYAAGVARAERGFDDLDLEGIFARLSLLFERTLRELQGETAGRRRLPRDPHRPEAVGPVGGDVEDEPPVAVGLFQFVDREADVREKRSKFSR